MYKTEKLFVFLAAPVACMSIFIADASAGKVSYDHMVLRQKDFSNNAELVGAVFAKADCSEANFKNSDLSNSILSDANFRDADLENANLSSAFADHVKFAGANLKNANLSSAMLSGVEWDGTEITGADFTDALVDTYANKKLCERASGVNSVTGVSTAESLGC